MYDYSKTNKILWDIETSELYEITYYIYIEYTNKKNHQLRTDGIQTQMSYSPLSNFLKLIEHNPTAFNGSLDKAIIKLRKLKIDRIKERINENK